MTYYSHKGRLLVY